MLTEGAERRMPADRRDPGRLADRGDGLGDGATFDLLAHAGVALPAPAVTGDLVTQVDRLAREPRRALDRASAGVDGRDRAALGERRRDPPPARPRPIFEVRILAEVGIAGDLLDRLVGALVALVAIRNRKFGAFLQIDDEGDGDARPVRPSDGGRMAAIAPEIPLGNACHVGSPVDKAVYIDCFGRESVSVGRADALDGSLRGDRERGRGLRPVPHLASDAAQMVAPLQGGRAGGARGLEPQARFLSQPESVRARRGADPRAAEKPRTSAFIASRRNCVAATGSIFRRRPF